MAEDENDDQEWNIRFKQDEEMDFFTELALHEAERWIQVCDICSRVFRMYTCDVIWANARADKAVCAVHQNFGKRCDLIIVSLIDN